MLNKFVPLTLGCVLLCAAVVNAQENSQQLPTTKYGNFIKRTDVVIVTQSHPLPDLPGGGGFRIWAKVAWALGETDKVYALEIANRIIDFDQLAGIQDGLDKMIKAVNTSFDTLNAASMSYASPYGVSASYYSYGSDGSDQPKRNLYFVAGAYVYQSPGIEPLTQFRDLIDQARKNLVALGAG